MAEDAAITSFEIDIPQDQLDDLRARLERTRWPDAEPVDDISQGLPLAQARALCDYWRDRYDWRRCETMLNGFGQFRTAIDGLGITFIHRRSPEPDAMPLLLTHGWPGSVIEFHKVIGPLSDPVAHGGRREDAFHLVIPALPGYGFSDKPVSTGWGVKRIASAWAELMRRLGYDRYVAQGGDWGSAVTTTLAGMGLAELAGVHLNMVIAYPEKADLEDLTEKEKATLARAEYYKLWGSGYARQQASRPQTLGYGLADSPAGQAAWIYEKFLEWTDCDGDPLTILTADELLDNIMLYWLTNSATSSARLYWESFHNFAADPIDIPVGLSVFPKEIISPSRRWAERKYRNIIHWNELERGGHFAAFEQPAVFVEEVRRTFRSLRQA
ncbi:MAG: epoxide hydrolase family protein [Sphingobium sp.]